MAFEYVPLDQRYRTQSLDYSDLTEQQQQSQQTSGLGGGVGGFGGLTDLIGGGGAGTTAATGTGTGATTATGIGTTAATGGSSISASAGPWATLAGIIGAEAENTGKTSDVSFSEQAKNLSLIPQKDFEHWGLEKYAPLGGGAAYKSTFDLNEWWGGAAAPFKELF
jgi:hypothetical protein